MENVEVELLRPPVAIGHGTGCSVAGGGGLSSHDWALTDVIHGLIGFGFGLVILSC